MISLVFDTETSDFPTKDYTSPKSGRLLQFYGALYEHDPAESMISVDADGRISCIAEPFSVLGTYIAEPVTSTPGAHEAHKITRETTDRLGIDPINAAHTIEDMLDISDRLVAHNTNFDIKVLRRTLWAAGIDVDILDEKEDFCTMRKLAPVMQLKPKKYNEWRWPSLAEAYQYMYSRDFEGRAHDAGTDARACADIYFGILHMTKGK